MRDNSEKQRKQFLGRQKKGARMEKKRESCESCVYNQKWFCIIVGDYVKRSGHCSEYEEQKKKIDTP